MAHDEHQSNQRMVVEIALRQTSLQTSDFVTFGRNEMKSANEASWIAARNIRGSSRARFCYKTARQFCSRNTGPGKSKISEPGISRRGRLERVAARKRTRERGKEKTREGKISSTRREGDGSREKQSGDADSGFSQLLSIARD